MHHIPMNTDTDGKVRITLSPQQVKKANEWMGQINVAHFDEECIPPGYDIVISVAGPLGQWAKLRCEGKELNLGEVEIDPLPGWGL